MKEIKFEGVTYFEKGGKYFVIDGFGKYEEVSPITASMIMERAISHAENLAKALSIMIENNWSTAHVRHQSQEIAKAALAEYRGSL